MDVPIRELKARLSEYLRRVRRGEEIVITHRGRPIGRIVPPAASEPAELDVVCELRALPWIRAGESDAPLGARNPLPHRAGEKTLADIVLEDRG